MIAVKEITDWKSAFAPNHTYLLDGNVMLAYIKQGETVPFYFKNPIRGFDRRGRKFITLKDNPFKVVDIEKDSATITVKGSNGNTYTVNTKERTCTCPGYSFRGQCKHIKDL